MDNISSQHRKNIRVSLTGRGTFHNRGLEFDKITQVGLNLADDFYALKKALPNLIYIYCLTKEKQIIHHPWIPSKKYKFEDIAYSYDIWKLGLPKNNPQQNVYWTEAYIDNSGETGGGIMASCGISIYHLDNFIGVVGADVTVDFLNAIVSEFEPHRKGHMIVFDANQNMLSHPSISYSDKKIKKLKDGLPIELASKLDSILKAPNNVVLKEGKWKFIKSSLAHSPFSVLYCFPNKPMADVVISRIGYGSIWFIVSMLVLVLASLYITHKKHIFEPFFTTKNSRHGTGLGLAAALGAIKNHNGYITVENAPGMGADFSILLPVIGKNVIGKSTKTKKINVSESKSKLLLIDDESEFCQMLTDFMGALGYTIVAYTDPLNAMEYYRKSWKEVDLVIMDMIMPKISGYDMINEFQKINSLARIVISSGYSEEKDIQKLFENHEHILGFYKKPFDLVKFANDIASLLEQEA